jgi:hypothetical protein
MGNPRLTSPENFRLNKYAPDQPEEPLISPWFKNGQAQISAQKIQQGQQRNISGFFLRQMPG